MTNPNTKSRIRMYSAAWCADCRRAKWLLHQLHVPCEEIDIEPHPDAAEFVRRANQEKYKVPTFEVDGRTFHCSPFDAAKLSRELGL